jgi:3-oxoacyl-[acyl-carrier-protein] synthase II
MRSRRVVITGLGPVTCFGVGAEPLWSAMLEPRTGIRRIQRFNPDGFDCRYAGELDDVQLNIKQIVPKSYRKATKVMCRDIELAVAGADAAVRDAGLVTKATDPDAQPTYPPHRVGCQIGAGLIAADVDELTAALVSSRSENGAVDLADWGANGMQNLTPLWLLKYLPNMLACHVTIIHDCQGPSNTITAASARPLRSGRPGWWRMPARDSAASQYLFTTTLLRHGAVYSREPGVSRQAGGR